MTQFPTGIYTWLTHLRNTAWSYKSPCATLGLCEDREPHMRTWSGSIEDSGFAKAAIFMVRIPWNWNVYNNPGLAGLSVTQELTFKSAHMLHTHNMFCRKNSSPGLTFLSLLSPRWPHWHSLYVHPWEMRARNGCSPTWGLKIALLRWGFIVAKLWYSQEGLKRGFHIVYTIFFTAESSFQCHFEATSSSTSGLYLSSNNIISHNGLLRLIFFSKYNSCDLFFTIFTSPN